MESLPQMHATLIPQGVMALQPPPEEAARQVTSVELRSPIEIFLAGLQSVGSWKGFLGYAAAGVVVWIGLYTNTNYLLVAAMLIAPFADPAMNLAIATARGDITLLQRSIARYFSALALTIFVALALSLILRQEISTSQMVQTSELSSVAVLLPLAGALNLVQSQRSSLVSGAASRNARCGFALAPPAGLVGMAIAFGRWDMVTSGLFVLLLQLVGINCYDVISRFWLIYTRNSLRAGQAVGICNNSIYNVAALIGLHSLAVEPAARVSTFYPRPTGYC